MTTRKPRYVVDPSNYHSVPGHGGHTTYYHLNDGSILAQTIVRHKSGTPADIYDSVGSIVEVTNEEGKKVDKFAIAEQDHFKEPAATPLGMYWKDFVKFTGGEDKVKEIAAKERMKAFWTWYNNSGKKEEKKEQKDKEREKKEKEREVKKKEKKAKKAKKEKKTKTSYDRP
jgi:hypothetical protein